MDSEIFLFGSRATKKFSYNSDIDIAIEPGENFKNEDIIRIKELIDESYVPFKVDIINLDEVSETFKKEVFKKAVRWR